MRYLFQVVRTQTATVYCRILPTLDHHVSDSSFSGSSDTNHDSSFLASHNFLRCNKLHSVVNGNEELLDPEWIRLADQVGNEWLENMKEISLLIGSNLKDGKRQEEGVEKNDVVNFDELCKAGKMWLTNMTNAVENEDGKLMQIVCSDHPCSLSFCFSWKCFLKRYGNVFLFGLIQKNRSSDCDIGC